VGVKKKVLFVINTLGRAGAEVALIGLLSRLDPDQYDVSLYVLMEQGELITKLPPGVRLLNDRYASVSVLSAQGAKQMKKRVLRAALSHGSFWKNLFPMILHLCGMIRRKRIQTDKLLWRMISDGAKRLPVTYDLAVAYLEGGSTYYVADHVKAKKKAAFLHIAYDQAGYTPRMDRDCYEQMDAIFAVSDEVKTHFCHIYPQMEQKTSVFHNMLDTDSMRRRSQEPGGFTDSFSGIRLLTVGRLNYQKAYDVAIEAMALVKASGRQIRWYVLGEGEKRKELERQIAESGVADVFFLLGATDNPYPYYVQADIYCHCTRFEGKSIAIQEAALFSLPIIASDCSGNREQICHGVDGILCPLTPTAIREAIIKLCDDQAYAAQLGAAAGKKQTHYGEDLDKLQKLVDEHRELIQ
jgi:glycosyltransferase involved in cell wall biosynthesis